MVIVPNDLNYFYSAPFLWFIEQMVSGRNSGGKRIGNRPQGHVGGVQFSPQRDLGQKGSAR